MNKRTVIAIFILVLIGLGCIDDSQAYIEEIDYEVVGIFIPEGIRQRGELKGEVFRIHDDELNVTLYIYIREKKRAEWPPYQILNWRLTYDRV